MPRINVVIVRAPRSHSRLTRSLRRFRRGDEAIAAFAQRALGEVYLRAADLPAAREQLVAALEAFRQFSIPRARLPRPRSCSSRSPADRSVKPTPPQPLAVRARVLLHAAPVPQDHAAPVVDAEARLALRRRHKRLQLRAAEATPAASRSASSTSDS